MKCPGFGAARYGFPDADGEVLLRYRWVSCSAGGMFAADLRSEEALVLQQSTYSMITITSWRRVRLGLWSLISSALKMPGSGSTPMTRLPGRTELRS